MRVLRGIGCLLAGLALGTGHAGALQQPMPADSTADRPLTGRARPCGQGHIEPFTCENVELLAYLPHRLLGNSTGNDLWGWHDSATGREFVVVGGEATAFVEVTDPLQPKYLGRLRPHARIEDEGILPRDESGASYSIAQSVKVYQHYALLATAGGDNGLQLFDLTQLRDVKNPPVEFQETAHYDSLGSTHTLAVDPATGFLYGNGGRGGRCGGGLHILDLRMPLRPAFAGCYVEPAVGGETPGWVHDSECVVYHGPDHHYQGREICLAAAVDGLAIADVTDKQHPKTISIARYPNVLYAHQAWFTEDQRYAFLDDEFDEGLGGQSVVDHTRTIGFDLQDLSDPVVLVQFLNSRTTSTDHNLYIRGHYMYQANYAAGLRIIDIADPQHPQEAGYLADIGSAWTNYPYLAHDVVAVSTSRGLFLVRLQRR